MHMRGDRGRRAYAATAARLSALTVSVMLQAHGCTARPLGERYWARLHSTFHVECNFCVCRVDREAKGATLWSEPMICPFHSPSVSNPLAPGWSLPSVNRTRVARRQGCLGAGIWLTWQCNAGSHCQRSGLQDGRAINTCMCANACGCVRCVAT